MVCVCVCVCVCVSRVPSCGLLRLRITDSDRATVVSSARAVSTYPTVGSVSYVSIAAM